MSRPTDIYYLALMYISSLIFCATTDNCVDVNHYNLYFLFYKTSFIAYRVLVRTILFHCCYATVMLQLDPIVQINCKEMQRLIDGINDVVSDLREGKRLED